MDLAKKRWTGVPPPEISGFLVAWHAARGDGRLLDIEQRPSIRVEGGRPIVIAFLLGYFAVEPTNICAVIRLDDGATYFVAFTPDAREG